MVKFPIFHLLPSKNSSASSHHSACAAVSFVIKKYFFGKQRIGFLMDDAFPGIQRSMLKLFKLIGKMNRKQHNWSPYKKKKKGGSAEAVGLWGTQVLLADWKVFDSKGKLAAWNCFSVPVVTVVKYDPNVFSVPSRISKRAEAVSGVCSFLSQRYPSSCFPTKGSC